MWVFGYGSLMWDGWEQAVGGQRLDGAVLPDYRRSFNKKSTRNWGTPAAPGPTLGLERSEGRSCIGTAFAFSDDQRLAIEDLLRQREGPSFALSELPVRLPGGREVQAITPVNNRRRRTYIGNAQVAERAAMARTARGENGDCSGYVRRIRDKLRELQIADPDVEEFARLIDG